MNRYVVVSVALMSIGVICLAIRDPFSAVIAVLLALTAAINTVTVVTGRKGTR